MSRADYATFHLHQHAKRPFGAFFCVLVEVVVCEDKRIVVGSRERSRSTKIEIYERKTAERCSAERQKPATEMK